MKTRYIAKQFDTICNFGFKNLIVAGCSFTYNNHETSACTWPYYLRDFGGFQTVYDFSMVGGGNTHICNAMIYGLEKEQISPNDSLVVVQWAGNDRDDYIIDPNALNQYPFRYYYSDQAAVGITGGQEITNFCDPTPVISLKKLKNKTCRSIENFVKIKSLHSYLTMQGYRTVFFEYRDYSLPGRDNNFDPREYLGEECGKSYSDMMSVMPENFYKFCLYNNLMEDDDFHPSPEGHLEWTKKCLVPFLIDYLHK